MAARKCDRWLAGQLVSTYHSPSKSARLQWSRRGAIQIQSGVHACPGLTVHFLMRFWCRTVRSACVREVETSKTIAPLAQNNRQSSPLGACQSGTRVSVDVEAFVTLCVELLSVLHESAKKTNEVSTKQEAHTIVNVSIVRHCGQCHRLRLSCIDH